MWWGTTSSLKKRRTFCLNRSCSSEKILRVPMSISVLAIEVSGRNWPAVSPCRLWEHCILGKKGQVSSNPCWSTPRDWSYTALPTQSSSCSETHRSELDHICAIRTHQNKTSPLLFRILNHHAVSKKAKRLHTLGLKLFRSQLLHNLTLLLFLIHLFFVFFCTEEKVLFPQCTSHVKKSEINFSGCGTE